MNEESLISKEYKINEFDSRYQQQVIDLIDTELRRLKVISEDSERINDEDLGKIEEVYKGRSRFWIAVDQEGSVIGTVAIREVSAKTAKLNRMFVSEKSHRKGIGQALLNCGLEFAKSQGYKEVILNTHISMSRAHSFYEKNGFTRTGLSNDKFGYKLEIT